MSTSMNERDFIAIEKRRAVVLEQLVTYVNENLGQLLTLMKEINHLSNQRDQLRRQRETAQQRRDWGTPMTVAEALEAYQLEEEALKTKVGKPLSFFVRWWLVSRAAQALGKDEEEITVDDVLAFTPEELKAKADDAGVECFGPVRLRILYKACNAAQGNQ
jgi:hypothetical protein